jgi:hypothetical protein
VIALLGYSGFIFGMPYYRYFALRSDAADMVRFEVKDEEKLKNRLFERAQRLGVQLEEENVRLQRMNGGYRMEVSWSETVNVLNIYNRELYFNFKVGK